MLDAHTDSPAPAGSDWVELSDDLLASPLADEWERLADGFEPMPHNEGKEMTDWLRTGIRDAHMPSLTCAMREGDELLGFFAVERVELRISAKSWPIFELRRRELRQRHRELARRPQPALMLSAIARADSTAPGFGRTLFKYALGLALADKPIVAVCVKPANERVETMWREKYRFREMDDPEEPGLLYFPVDPPPEAEWP